MKFLWPELLWLLLMLPALVGTYVFVLRRKRKAALKYGQLRAVNATDDPTMTAARRQIPPLLYLLAFAAALIAVARPTAVATLPSQYQTIILAIDTSGSMSAKDVNPDRLSSARAAARAFVADQTMNTRIGVVAFAATASLVQSPTYNREDLVAAIDRLRLEPGTAVGSAILASLKSLFPDEQFEVEASNPRRKLPRDDERDSTGGSGPNEASKEPAKSQPPGSYTHAAIVMFTDGQTTTGPDPLEAARIAADRGVRVYTVGVGTLKGEVVTVDGWSMRALVDEEALKAIAASTRGEYFYGGSASELKQVYAQLNARLFWERKQGEITALFMAATALLAFLGGLLSLWWFDRIL